MTVLLKKQSKLLDVGRCSLSKPILKRRQAMESWWDKIALDLIKRNGGRKVTICTGTAVLDSFHVGNMREFFIAEMIKTAVVFKGGEAEHIVYIDDLDPLKKLYPHLSDEYQQWVGCPLKKIPDPYGCHPSYAAHYTAELQDIFRYLGMDPTVVFSSSLYESGFYLESVMQVLENREKIKAVIHQMTGNGNAQEKPDEEALEDRNAWFFMPECPECHSIQKTAVNAWVDGTTQLDISCECGFEGGIDFSQGGGKLTWRADWPMRLSSLGIDLEPNGPSHTSSGGSFDSAIIICQDIFQSQAPVSFPYAWVCHGKKSKIPGQKNPAMVPMRSARGNAILMKDLMGSYPPEIFWWMFARRDPGHEFEFHPDRTLLEESHSIRVSNGAGEILTQYFPVPISEHFKQIPFDHLVTVAQIAGFDARKIQEILGRSPTYRRVADMEITGKDLDYIKQWLDTSGGQFKINLAANSTAPSQLLQLLAKNLEAVSEWTADEISAVVQQTANDEKYPVKVVFQECYRKLFNQPHGPKLAFMLESMGKQETIKLLT